MANFETGISKDTLTYSKKIVFNAGVEASLDYANPKTNFSPKIQLLFSPFGLPFIPIEIVGTNINKIISSLSWNKDRNNPDGILSVTITPDAQTIKDIVKIIDKISFNLYSKIWGELGVDLEDLFKPMTLCQLWIDGYHVSTCTVRSCMRSSGVSNEDKQLSYSLTLDGLGMMYNLNTVSMDTIAIDALQVQISDAINSAFEFVARATGVSLAVGIKLLVNAFKISSLGVGVNLSDGLPLSLRLITESNPLGGIGNLAIANFMIVDSSLFELNSNGGGLQSIWSFLKSFLPSPWMEFFTESGGRTIVTEALGAPSVLFPGFNYVVARSTPYSNPLIGTVNPAHITTILPFDLTTIQMLIGGDFIIITDDMIQEKNLGIDSINQATVFHSRYGNKAASGGSPDRDDKSIKAVGPLNPFASGGIGTFGIREMFQSIDSTSLKGYGTAVSYVERIAKNMFGLPFKMLSKNQLSNLLAVWFRNQSRFREGTVTTRMIPYARPGMYCLYLPSLSGKKAENLRDIGMYYIDSLTHSYGLSNDDLSYTTTLNLIRGVPIPATVAQTALLLFDYEVLPPEMGIGDGVFRALNTLRRGIRKI